MRGSPGGPCTDIQGSWPGSSASWPRRAAGLAHVDELRGHDEWGAAQSVLAHTTSLTPVETKTLETMASIVNKSDVRRRRSDPVHAGATPGSARRGGGSCELWNSPRMRRLRRLRRFVSPWRDPTRGRRRPGSLRSRVARMQRLLVVRDGEPPRRARTRPALGSVPRARVPAREPPPLRLGVHRRLGALPDVQRRTVEAARLRRVALRALRPRDARHVSEAADVERRGERSGSGRHLKTCAPPDPSGDAPDAPSRCDSTQRDAFERAAGPGRGADADRPPTSLRGT